MRIISGKYKGRIIKMPGGIRPTQDKVRKALFDILGDIEGASFLDLYAGSGIIGLEAISRGVKEVVFIEKDSRCINIIKKNLGMLDAVCLPDRQGCWMLDKKDVFEAIRQLGKQGKKFDIIFLDPPYYQDMAKKTLKILSCYGILTPYGLIVAQHFKKDILPEKIDNLTLYRQSIYGDTVLSFYRKVMRSKATSYVSESNISR